MQTTKTCNPNTLVTQIKPIQMMRQQYTKVKPTKTNLYIKSPASLSSLSVVLCQVIKLQESANSRKWQYQLPNH
jgi:hypothetical protein